MITRAEVRQTEKRCGNMSRMYPGNEVVSSSPKLSLSVVITLWKLSKKVFYFFYKINAKNFFSLPEQSHLSGGAAITASRLANRGSAANILVRNPKQVSLLAGKKNLHAFVELW